MRPRMLDIAYSDRHRGSPTTRLDDFNVRQEAGERYMIDLHYWPTPNGKKVTILLEELGMPCNIVPCNIGKGDQFEPEFLKISPNNRMPALVDHAPADGGPTISVFKSGAIMMYLAEKAGRFYPQDIRRRYEVNQWVMWQMANQGPKLGECGHFLRLGDKQGDQSYAVRRFTDEANRLYGVLNNRLYDRRYLAGDEYTIADMICYPWTVMRGMQAQLLAQPETGLAFVLLAYGLLFGAELAGTLLFWRYGKTAAYTAGLISGTRSITLAWVVLGNHVLPLADLFLATGMVAKYTAPGLTKWLFVAHYRFRACGNRNPCSNILGGSRPGPCGMSVSP